MPKLTVVIDEIVQEIPFSQGSSLRELLSTAGIRIRSGCLGNGACGLCLVKVVEGEVNEPTRSELLGIPPEQLEGNMRLACQVMPEKDLSVSLPASIARTDWRDLPAESVPYTPTTDTGQAAPPTDAGYGVAVDLGTTHISLSLWSLSDGQRLQARIGLNPQSCHGSDVVTRLIAAGQSAEAVKKIARLPLEAIAGALNDICKREEISPRQIRQVSIVGNTPMMALLTETDPCILLQPSSWTQPLDCRPGNLEAWVELMGIHPEAAIEIVSPLAGFVGSDLLAGVLATGMTDRPNGLLIDFGTNSEIALWDGGTLWVTSAAGGPAFEGCGIQCGMPAESGAIYRIMRDPDSGAFDLEVIGGAEAKGLCGSGLVDLIASLRGTGELTATGKFSGTDGPEGFVVHRNSSTIRLTKADVDMLQRAKAAIGVGVNTLLQRAGIQAKELDRIYVCGAFGRHLDTSNAQLIGLLPDIAPERIELCGNTALAGCEQLLLSGAKKRELELLRGRTEMINLSQTSDFEALFMENLYLQPQTAGGS